MERKPYPRDLQVRVVTWCLTAIGFVGLVTLAFIFAAMSMP